jgi:filamentous hemagglutinin family protein
MKKKIELVVHPLTLAITLALAGQAQAVGTGSIASGTGSISQNGSTTTVTQTSDKLIVNWDSMNVGKGETLNFAQKNSASSVLNRINSADPTIILGALKANGNVFIVNPNGVLIGKGATVNVGSLVASSLNISDADFNAGKLNFAGGGKGEVLNEGDIVATGSVGLIGQQVKNRGTIKSAYGDVVLAAGEEITLSFSGTQLQAKLNKGSLDALINNDGLIATPNGDIVLTAWARDALTRGVINNSGTLEAGSVSRYYNGSNRVIRLASLGNGEVRIGGKITATGGSIAASGRGIAVQDDAVLTTQAARPYDFNNGNVILTATPAEGAAGYVKFGKAKVTANLLNITADNVVTAGAGKLPTLDVNRALVKGTTADRNLVVGGTVPENEADKLHNGAGTIDAGFLQAASRVAVSTGGKGNLTVAGYDAADNNLELFADEGTIRFDQAIKGQSLNAITKGKIGQSADASMKMSGGVVLFAGDALTQNADIDGGTFVALNSTNGLLTQAKGVRTTARDSVYFSGRKGVTLSGTTSAGRVMVSGSDDGVLLDGAVDAQSLEIGTHGNMTLDGTVKAGRVDIHDAAKVSDTVRSSLTADRMSITGGDVDLTHGSNAISNLALRNVKSADLAVTEDLNLSADRGYDYSTGKEQSGVAGNLRVRGLKNVELNDVYAGGNIDADAKGNLGVGGQVRAGGDLTLHGQNVVLSDSRNSGYGYVPPSGDLYAGGKLTVTAEDRAELGRLRGASVDLRAKSIKIRSALATGNVDLAATDDLLVWGGSVKAGGDANLTGKRVTITNEGEGDYMSYGPDADYGMAGGRLEADGKVTVTADDAVNLRDVQGKSVDVTSKNGSVKLANLNSRGDAAIRGAKDVEIGDSYVDGNLAAESRDGLVRVGFTQVGGNAYLAGKTGLNLGKRIQTGGNLKLETQGNVEQSQGNFVVGGDLEYKLAEDSKVVRPSGVQDEVKGKTTGLKEEAKPEPKPEDEAKPDPKPADPKADAPAKRPWDLTAQDYDALNKFFSDPKNGEEFYKALLRSWRGESGVKVWIPGGNFWFQLS